MLLALNRLVSTLSRVEQEFWKFGINTVRFGCLDTEAIDVTLNPKLINFDRFDHVIVTSPEAMHHLIASVRKLRLQWPKGQIIWSVGDATAAPLRCAGLDVCCIDRPGSSALIPEIIKILTEDARVVVACGFESGRQFLALNRYLAEELSYLELYRAFSVVPNDELSQVTHILHGSATCAKAFFELGLSADHLVHIITSDRAKSHLSPGSRYYQIEGPMVEQVLKAIQGELSVKH